MSHLIFLFVCNTLHTREHAYCLTLKNSGYMKSVLRSQLLDFKLYSDIDRMSRATRTDLNLNRVSQKRVCTSMLVPENGQLWQGVGCFSRHMYGLAFTCI